MQANTPASISEFAEAYASAYARGTPFAIAGAGTKMRFGGPSTPSSLCLSTAALTRVAQYEPRDLAISVEAGMPFSELEKVLDENGQMLPLDPPFAEQATIGGVVASNLCGSRRRAYGTARDFVIGVQFVDARGRTVESGAMVAKNVAGYDLNKLFVGSWGVLGPLVRVNLRVMPREAHNTSFAVYGRSIPELSQLRDDVLRAPVQPVAVDYVNKASAEMLRLDGAALLLRYACAPAAVSRVREVLGLPDPMDEENGHYIWVRLREWMQQRTKGHADGVLIQLSTVNSRLFLDASSLGGLVVARAASGVVYAFYRDVDSAVNTLQFLEAQGRAVAVLSAPAGMRESRALWWGKRSDFSVMQQLKKHFDPDGLVNPRRLYGAL